MASARRRRRELSSSVPGLDAIKRFVLPGRDPGTLTPRLLIELTAVLWQEDQAWVGQCVELDITASGKDPDDAYDQLIDAVEAYLNTLEELGERDEVLARRNVPIYSLAPAEFRLAVPRELASRQGAHARPVELPVSSDKTLVPA